MPKKSKSWLRWAVLSRRCNLCINSMQWSPAIYATRLEAEMDCAPSQHAGQVRITVVKARKK